VITIECACMSLLEEGAGREPVGGGKTVNDDCEYLFATIGGRGRAGAGRW